MADKKYPQSGLPIRQTIDLLPQVFKTPANAKFMAGVVDPLVQPGTLEKKVGYIGRRWGKTYKGSDVYLDSDATLRSRYQLEPGVIVTENDKIKKFYDYIDFKNQLRFFGNTEERDDLVSDQEHYSWNPPIDWDKFINFREYYWVPEGPPTITIDGQAQDITSTYRVKLGNNSTWLFSPDGYTINPTLRLYRGQTYSFQINSPGEKFTLRSVYNTGNPLELSVDYNTGITNNGITSGTLTFKVPLDAPSVIFYQSDVDVDRLGRFIISDVESNTKINVETEILGKATYVSSNGITLSNGMNIRFNGDVLPAEYADDVFAVEGVGTAIKLIRFQDLVVSPRLNADVPEVLFDNTGFDTDPFDDATAFPLKKDYLTINKSSPDNNPWSRYNRWFHRSVLEQAHAFNNSSFDYVETARAKRPIIEFKAGLQLFNHGSVSKQTVDYVDTFTDDVFSKIEGSLGYNVDGEQLFDGARLLIVADTDPLANNRIYEVKFITHNNTKQISLKDTSDTVSVVGECVLVRRGTVHQGTMFHYDGSSWLSSQKKTAVNQPPLFDAFDNDGVSLSNIDTYPVSSFIGTEIISYKIGNSIVDSELGFSISYLNIDNVGDIEFEFDWDTDFFTYQIYQNVFSKNVNVGYFKFNPDTVYSNGWAKTDQTFLTPILDSQVVIDPTIPLTFNTIDWKTYSNEEFYVYVNGSRYTGTITQSGSKFTFSPALVKNDTVVIKVFGDVPPDQGYYEIPVGLEKNPLNQELTEFTLGTATDHIASSVEFEEKFTGQYPGVSNLRDIDGYIFHAKRFLKHSGIPAASISLLCDKDVNLIKSLQYAKKSYTEFKNNFIKLSTSLFLNQNSSDFVDEIISEMSRSKSSANSFADTDMVGSGAYSKIEYEVEDIGIKTFALSTKFDLTALSRKAVYAYVNDTQLLVNRDYNFDATFGFIKLTIDLVEGDMIEIREYVSTTLNFIPPTPTKLGLYKKYTPMMFLDDTYLEPKMMIQGHDGSLTTAYGDFRDALLLELEYRIYNNIKQEYNESVFDIDSVLGGYYGNALYNKSQLDTIVTREFLKWVADTNIDYVSNQFFDSQNSFTYTYSSMVDPAGTTRLPGWWRGVYSYFYDTDRPHRCPWEMLGFSEQPLWWESEYGAAPYTSGNLILWEDLRDGIIRSGTRAGTYDRYKRPTLLDHLPVDADGKLLSPLDSNLAQNFALVNSKGNFKLGDVAPVEHAWRSSSEWPFALSIAMSLMKPFEFITDSLDRFRMTTNILGQTINSDTGVYLNLKDIKIPRIDGVQTSGLINYIADFLKNKNLTDAELENLFLNLDIRLTSRLSGFVDQTQQKYILDSKNPRSTSSSVYIPAENYDIIFNVSSPISSVSYSGVIIEKTDRGWKVDGYDNAEPYFNFYAPIPSQVDPAMVVGGVSENFFEWSADKYYGNGVIVRYSSNYYRSLQSHTSETNFDNTKWKQIPALPLVGGVQALKRRNFNTLKISQFSYGTVLGSIQEVVDLLLGYEVYLKSIGMAFGEYDSTTQTAKDWTTAAKEFMFWTKHNWELGSLITLSPAANKIDITNAIGVADSLLDSFYDYQILKSDGTPLLPVYINVNREFQKFTIETTNTPDGIYYLRVYFVLKEHVVVFSDRTVFNDVIYHKSTGYRQERIKGRGFRTVDWDGDYTSPGFLFDNVDIRQWQPFIDYRLGDIVAYKSYNWVSKVSQPGVAEFIDSTWSKLDSTPTKGLVSNFDYRINQFDDYFNLDADGVGAAQRDLGRHAIGYQARDYLQGLAEDEVSQFNLFQGFIREKGTANSVVKIFDKLSRTAEDGVVLNEEWAFRVGNLGGLAQTEEIEFKIHKDELLINPQPILVVPSVASNVIIDQYLRLDPTDFTIPQIPFNVNTNPMGIYDTENRTSGYVKSNLVQHVLKSRDDLLTANINLIVENDHVWITFDGPSWTVLRFNQSPTLIIESAVKTDASVEILFNRSHLLAVDEIVGIKDVINLTGFYKITAVGPRSITISVDSSSDDPALDPSTITNIYLFTNARFTDYQHVSPTQVALLRTGSKLWIDNNVDGLWETIEKTQQFTVKDLVDYGTADPQETGSSVLYLETLKQIISSMPRTGYVMSYTENTDGLGLKQIIAPPDGFENMTNRSFGKSLAATPDFKFLIVGTPKANGVPSSYRGTFIRTAQYFAGEIVLYNGRLWKAVNDIPGYLGDSTNPINLYTEDWALTDLIEANTVGRNKGYTEQGMITVYEWRDQQWTAQTTLLSPRPADNEQFGHAIAVGVSGTKYYMSVSAPGSLDNRGRVYLYVYENGVWHHLENLAYQGNYNDSYPGSSTFYPKGSIVWSYDADDASQTGYFWEALVDTSKDGSTLSVNSTDWKKLTDAIATSCTLPRNTELDRDDSDDDSSLTVGPIDADEVSELTKQGDMFGSSMAMNRDGSILVIGVPFSDGQYFANYRGVWRDTIEYTENDVVNHDGQYYKLFDPRLHEEDWDSTQVYTSTGELPDSDPWLVVGDSTLLSTGKIHVYQRNSVGSYELKQTITTGSLDQYSDLAVSETINVGDEFGFSLDFDSTGTTLVVSSPRGDINGNNQGCVYLFKTANLNSIEYRLKQKLESFESYSDEFFGSSVSISSGTERIVIGAKNASYKLITRFDTSSGTMFDQGKTVFSEAQGYPGQVYVFERKDQQYFLAEKLQAELVNFESFGYSVDCSSSVVVVGSPTYKQQPDVITDIALSASGYGYTTAPIVVINPATGDQGSGASAEAVLGEGAQAGRVVAINMLSGGTDYNATPSVELEGGGGVGATVGAITIGSLTGRTRLFKKDATKNSFEVVAAQQPLVDINKIRNIAVYDPTENIKIADLDFVDHFKMKILGIADQEIKFKTIYDPAIYNVGTDEQVVDNTLSWFEKHVGELWWDLSTVKWLDYEQGDFSYRIGNWNKLANGASVDVYEWVKSPLLPSEWSIIADSVEGLVENISGQPLYPDDTVYSIKTITNPTTGLTTGTLYYYWVKNSKIVPPNSTFRKLAASEVAAAIQNPGSTGIPFIAFIDSDKYLAYNFNSLITADTAIINIQLLKTSKPLNLIHHEYQLLTEGVADSLPTASLETKWIDSLVGFDQAGNAVPDPKLPAKHKYGVSYRPRQSMFIDKTKILKIVIDRINTVLASKPFTETLDSVYLNLVDPLPVEGLNQYDLSVDTYLDLTQVGTVRIKQATLRINLVDGKIDTIDVIDSGFGYRKAPPVVIQGTGKDAKAIAVLDAQGRVSAVNVINKGRKYSSAVANIRPYSVLVKTDETSDGFWTIYAWDQKRKSFYRSKSQGFDTTKYWNYIDYWATGYSETSRVVQEISNFYLEPTINVDIGDLVKVKEFANGGWAVLQKSVLGQGTISENYNLIGRQNGTIKLASTLYSSPDSLIGYDNVGSYDASLYDLQPTKELRTIFTAVKEDIFIDDLAVEWNNLFFASVRHAFSEQLYIDWAFKTSFLNAIHNVGDLEQKISYKNDNLDSFRQYLEEVKPYRTSIREYTSRYTELQPTGTSVSDFDLPPAYSERDGKILPISETYNRYNEYPWKWFTDNQGYAITDILVSSSGAGYLTPPTVLIEGNGTGAQAQAYISSGKLSAIKMLNTGVGYTTTPVIKLIGGTDITGSSGSAVAILGNGKIRAFNMTVKFDRISKTGIYNSLTHSQTFTATGSSAVFNLDYAPTRDKSKIIILKNGQPVLNNEYSINLYTVSSDAYEIIRGKIIFVLAPASGDTISINYEKNDTLLDSINRIEKYYAPTSGMKGKSVNQLMTGIDYGGVQIQGTTFDVTGGWDALPWFTDNWDSVEAGADYYYILDFDIYSQSEVYQVSSVVQFTDGIKYKALQVNINKPPDDPEFTGTWEPLTINLPYIPEDGQAITIYIKRDGEQRAIRIDDPYYDLYDGSTIQPNGLIVAPINTVVNSFIGDGIQKTVEILSKISTFRGDTLIFRPLTSDGSVTINDVNLLDTLMSGGTLAALESTNTKTAPNAIDGAYVSANGMLAEDISIDGGKFITPTNVPAPEENIPGQVLDSVSIKVYTSPISGATPMQTKVFRGDGTTFVYNIGLKIFENTSLILYVDKEKQIINVDYTINFSNNTVEFINTPLDNTLVELIAIGIGGVELLDYQEFIADGETSLFLTKAVYTSTQSIVVTVDGEIVDVGFTNSTGIIDRTNRTLVQFGIKPTRLQVVKIICLGAALDTDSTGSSLIRINQQTFVYDGSTRSLDLDTFVNLGRGSAQSSMLVEVNGLKLLGVDTTYQVYDGNNNSVIVGIDPAEAVGTITSGNIKVFVNGILLRFVLDYTYSGNENTIDILSEKLVVGDVIKVESDVRAQFSVLNNNIVLSSELTLVENDTIEVTWFSEYPTMDLITDEYTGGKVQYYLPRTPLSISYIWIYKNGQRLTQDQDYYIDLPRSVVYLVETTTVEDNIKIVQFSSNVYTLPSAYEVSKDMLNVYHFKRYSKTNVKLSKELTYYDQQIELTDASAMSEPIKSRNIPGTVEINGEKIEYLEKSGNILKQLRRGSRGTPIPLIHNLGSFVVNMSFDQNIPYNESQDRADFIIDSPSTFTYDGSSSFEIETMQQFGYGVKENLIVYVNSSLIPSSEYSTITVNNDPNTSGLVVLNSTVLLKANDIITVASLLVGPLDFVPSGSTRNTWYRSNIPEAYNACDNLEVFVSGRRLRKDPMDMYSEDNGATSPSSDIQIEAEFSSDGATSYVRLSELPPVGTRITMIRRTGQTWYEAGETTATNGKSLLRSNTTIARFIAAQTAELPE